MIRFELNYLGANIVDTVTPARPDMPVTTPNFNGILKNRI